MKKGTQILLALLALGASPALAQETGATWDNRPTFLLGDGSRIEIHARLQSDYLVRNEADPDAASLSFDDRLSLPRKRVGVEGMLFDRVAFQVEGEVGDTQPWRDVFADVKINRALHVRAGRFKVPFSLEQLTSGTDLDFIARASAVSDLSPSRDIGVMAHGRLADRALKYEAGVFEVDASSRLWKSDAVRTLAGRVTIAPLADGKSRGSDALEISAALLRTDVPEGRGGPSGHLVMGDTFFRSMFVSGTRTRVGASVAWNAARASLRAEVIRSMDTRLGQGIDGSDLSNLVSTGGYVAGLWHLAAHDGHRYGHAPLRALDLTARFDRLSFGSAGGGEAFLNPRADHVAPIGKDAWTLGVNWHPNRWVKVQANTVREQIVDPLALLPIGTTPFWSTVLRFQVAM
ncbi:MAG TPA: porin [Vicinamibacterales bacterium]|nr:porin [Vicinamibacterales bacterium]